jgi:hypothetical protein
MHRYDKFQMFNPALRMASVSEENFSVLAMYFRKMYTRHVNHSCVTILPLQEFTILPTTPL